MTTYVLHCLHTIVTGSWAHMHHKRRICVLGLDFFADKALATIDKARHGEVADYIEELVLVRDVAQDMVHDLKVDVDNSTPIADSSP